jgi:hypothetical protein
LCHGKSWLAEHLRIAGTAGKLRDEDPRERCDQERLEFESVKRSNVKQKCIINHIIPGAPTAPKRMASCFRNSSKPPSGIYFPVFLYVSELQSKWVKFSLKVPRVLESVCRTFIPASITSGPMPSAGMEAMLYVCVEGRADGDMSADVSVVGDVDDVVVQRQTATSLEYPAMQSCTGDLRRNAMQCPSLLRLGPLNLARNHGCLTSGKDYSE